MDFVALNSEMFGEVVVIVLISAFFCDGVSFAQKKKGARLNFVNNSLHENYYEARK